MAGANADAGRDTGPVPSPETLRVRRIWDKMALGFDKQMRFFERVLFPGAREWACSQANERVLEIAVGTGRNLSYYPDGVDLTGIEYSPAMLAIAHEKARELGRKLRAVMLPLTRLSGICLRHLGRRYPGLSVWPWRSGSAPRHPGASPGDARGHRLW